MVSQKKNGKRVDVCAEPIVFAADYLGCHVSSRSSQTSCLKAIIRRFHKIFSFQFFGKPKIKDEIVSTQIRTNVFWFSIAEHDTSIVVQQQTRHHVRNMKISSPLVLILATLTFGCGDISWPVQYRRRPKVAAPTSVASFFARDFQRHLFRFLYIGQFSLLVFHSIDPR
jgi:hypothetical protein